MRRIIAGLALVAVVAIGCDDEALSKSAQAEQDARGQLQDALSGISFTPNAKHNAGAGAQPGL